MDVQVCAVGPMPIRAASRRAQRRPVVQLLPEGGQRVQRLICYCPDGTAIAPIAPRRATWKQSFLSAHQSLSKLT